jgi:hypothetical protein
MNNVYYTSGITNSGTLVQVQTTNNGDFFFDSFLSESGLLEITSGVLLSIINSDNVFEVVAVNDDSNFFPVFKEVGVITIENQRQIAIPWIE